jgi:hypothetical protein
MSNGVRTDLFYGIFEWHPSGDGHARVVRPMQAPSYVPDPRTGRRLRISSVQASARAICPSCARKADGGFVSFEADPRLAYACPECLKLVWINGT